MIEYLDFDLEIGLGEGREYPVKVTASPQGTTHSTLAFPFDDQELKLQLMNLQSAIERSVVPRRQVLSQREQAAREFGQKLFEALFSGEVGTYFDNSWDLAVSQDKGLRVRLSVLAPELAILPWEYLYYPRQVEYLCLSRYTPLVRYLKVMIPPKPLEVQPPLRVLGMVASPSDLTLLEVEKEKKNLAEALQPLQKKDRVELKWLEGQTSQDLQNALQGGPWHIFHFIGHGGFDRDEDQGVLALVGEDGKKQELSAEELGRLLADHRTIRLVVLNACQGAQESLRDLFSSTASALVKRGLPAVLAMQYDITDRAAIRLSQQFYRALANGLPVDAALVEARKSISIALKPSLEWGIPVLHMRSPDGVLFKLPEPVKCRLQKWAYPAIIAGLLLFMVSMAWIFRVPPLFSTVPTLTPQLQQTWTAQAVAGASTESAAATATAAAATLDAQHRQATQTAQAELDTQLTAAAAATTTKTPTPTISPTPLPKFITDAKGVHLALVPAGPFQMGSSAYANDEKPIHTVTLSAFYMDQYEVTNAQYQKCVDAGGCNAPEIKKSFTRSRYYNDIQFADYPVIYVSWNQARTYCEWRGGRLPSEAEWEKAARGGLEGKRYPWGDESPVCTPGAVNGAQFGDCILRDTVSVGSFSPNGYGLYDMAGNVWEWVNDWYQVDYYSISPASDPPGPYSGVVKTLRGGGWYLDKLYNRVASRITDAPDYQTDTIGFRCAASIP